MALSLDPRPLADVTQAWFAQFAPLWEESRSLERMQATVGSAATSSGSRAARVGGTVEPSL